MFFEAPSIGCRQTIFDVIEVTYNTYSCVISCMSREMMKMDGRDSAKCQKSKLVDIDGIFGIVLSDNRKKVNSFISFIKNTKTKTCWKRNCLQWLWILSFSERESHFSLKYWAIRLSELFGTRRKVALRIEAYSWTSVLRSFDKLREVGDLSYLGLLFV